MLVYRRILSYCGMRSFAIRPPARISASFSPRDSFERRWDPLSRRAFRTRTAQGLFAPIVAPPSFLIIGPRNENNPEHGPNLHPRRLERYAVKISINAARTENEQFGNSKVTSKPITRLIIVSFAITDVCNRIDPRSEWKYMRLYVVTFIVEFDHSSRATRYSTSIPRDATRFGSGNQFSLEKFSSIPRYLRTGE